VSDITTRNKPHKDPEAILNQVQHMVQDAPVQQQNPSDGLPT